LISFEHSEIFSFPLFEDKGAELIMSLDGRLPKASAYEF